MPLDETKNKELRTGKGYKRGIGWEGAIPNTAQETTLPVPLRGNVKRARGW
jgi:hypothetical protein